MDKINQGMNESGLLTTILGDELDGKLHIQHHQDLTPHVEYATALRNDDSYTKAGIKKGWMHAAHIPDVVVIELKSIGVDVFKSNGREIVAGLKRLNKEYLLTTRANV